MVDDGMNVEDCEESGIMELINFVQLSLKQGSYQIEPHVGCEDLIFFVLKNVKVKLNN